MCEVPHSMDSINGWDEPLSQKHQADFNTISVMNAPNISPWPLYFSFHVAEMFY